MTGLTAVSKVGGVAARAHIAVAAKRIGMRDSTFYEGAFFFREVTVVAIICDVRVGVPAGCYAPCRWVIQLPSGYL